MKCSWIGQAVGNTPLIKLNGVSEDTGCQIYGKAEWMNPGGSVKDRAALFMVLDAEEKGLLSKGSCLVEATAGNTGLSLLMIGLQRGYKCIFTCPPSASKEKKDLLRKLGAEVVECPSVPGSDPQHFQKVAARMAEELGGLFVNQFYNDSNTNAHYMTTGREIWEQTEGEIDYLVASAGTGGSMVGTTKFLKEQNDNVKCLFLEIVGQTVTYSKEDNTLRTRTPEEIVEHSSVLEGVGSGKLYGPLQSAQVDGSFICPDTSAAAMCYYLMKNEGLFLGGSSGLNVSGAYWLAKKLGPGHTIVTFLCDGGERYDSKIYNKQFLEEKNVFLPEEITLEYIYDTLSEGVDNM